MKTYALLFILIASIFTNANAEIHNALQRELTILNAKKQALVNALNTTNEEKKIKAIQKKIKKIQKEIDNTKVRYEETNRILQQLKDIDPNLFETVSAVKNAEGDTTSVYVKIVDDISNGSINYSNNAHSIAGFTNIAHLNDNPNVSASEYGVNTISVIINGDRRNTVGTLAHEFGHVLYLVQNLKEYVKFYKEHYDSDVVRQFGFGHSPHDPGHNFVRHIEKTFKKNYQEYTEKNSIAL